jgi:hypothetical protein
MSHIVVIKTQVRDPAALAAACTRLGLAAPTQGIAELFSGQATGLLVNLPGWRFPVVVDIQAGQVHYDNFNGAWGNQTELDRLLQAYAIEKARIEARKAGHAVTEQPLPDGSVKLTIHLGGAS